jgi:hypothetical protein
VRAGVRQVLAKRITGLATASICKRCNLNSEADMVDVGRNATEYAENGVKKGRSRDLEAINASKALVLPN